jgi:hypothetical protein
MRSRSNENYFDSVTTISASPARKEGVLTEF